MSPSRHPLARAFILAVRNANPSGPQPRLVMLGDGPLLAQVRGLLQEAGMAHLAWLPGARDDVARVMRGMDLFVLPSLAEGVSNTILEAMASGLPVVIADLPGARGVSRDGDHGVHVAPGDLDDLVRGVRALVDAGRDGRRRKGEAARAHVVEHYAWARCAELLEAVYEEIV